MLATQEASAPWVWNRCATLEHTWLKRRLLPQLSPQGALWLVGDQRVVPPVLLGIPVRLTEVQNFLRDALEGYSPVQLMGMAPLADLPPNLYAELVDTVHQRYLDAQVIQPLITAAAHHSAEMRATTDTLLAIWAEGSLDRRAELLEQLHLEAEALREALAAFPSENVLP